MDTATKTHFYAWLENNNRPDEQEENERDILEYINLVPVEDTYWLYNHSWREILDMARAI